MAYTHQLPQIETLLPHRGRMLLIDKIVKIEKDAAISLSTVKPQWPLFNNNCVSPLLIIELVAQTSGLNNGLNHIQAEGVGTTTKGLLVGIKNAVFYVNDIACGAIIETHTKNSFEFEGFREIQGFSKVGQQMIGEVILQVMRAD